MITQSKEFFFNRPDFIRRRAESKILTFPQNASGPRIYFTNVNDELISLDKSTFGGFIMDTHTTEHELADTCSEFLTWATGNKMRSITIKCFPEVYALSENILSSKVLLRSGFKILFHDITQVFVIDGSDLQMNTHRKRRLRSCLAQNFKFKKLSKEFLPEAFTCFEQSRRSKGYPITMSLQEFQSAFDKFPDNYLLFGIFDANKMIAASVNVIINTKILYCFFIGDILEYRKYSPVTQLLNGIYYFAKQYNFSIVDLGISTDKGILNAGLYQFKKSMGTVDSPKLTYQIKL